MSLPRSWVFGFILAGLSTAGAAPSHAQAPTQPDPLLQPIPQPPLSLRLPRRPQTRTRPRTQTRLQRPKPTPSRPELKSSSSCAAPLIRAAPNQVTASIFLPPFPSS
jgi:hypothetical protein